MKEERERGRKEEANREEGEGEVKRKEDEAGEESDAGHK